MAFKFEQLKIWQIAMELGEDINKAADSFPGKEIYNLGSQIRRAADSIALNIAEGSTGQTDPEQRRFLNYANRSTLEVVTCLIKAKRRKYIEEKRFYEFYTTCESLSRMILAFIKKIR
ncbi:MAG: four helix bundle protein [Chitinophagaceae bacterium]|nr:four helix bundle protein [Chitinophagaceae bacterium]